MKIAFLPHARESMSFWQVSEERARRALLAPDHVRQGDRPERKVAQSQIANEALPVHVVYTSEIEDEYVVITVYRGRPKKGD